MTPDDDKAVIATLRSKYDELHSAEKRAADYIISDPSSVMEMSVAQLASKCSVSDATIVRMCQHVGYEGYYQMRLYMSKDLGRAGSIDFASVSNDPVGYAFDYDLAYLKSLTVDKNKAAIVEAARLIRSSNNVVVTAAGNTIPVALDLSFRLNRFSVKSFASAIEEQCVNYVSNSGKDDLLVAISKSGMTVRILQIIDYAKKHGLKVLAITGDEDSSMARQADCVVNSGGSNTVFSNIQNGLETHIGEHLVIDALLIVLDGLQTDQDRKEEAEFEIASWKV